MKRAILLLAILALTGQLLQAGSAPQTIHVTTAVNCIAEEPYIAVG